MDQQNPKHADSAGSTIPGEPAFVAIGRLGRPHGIRGEILMDIWTDFPERIHPKVVVYCGPAYEPLRVHTLRWHGKSLLLTFEGYDTPEAIGKLRNRTLYVSTADRPALPEGEFYVHQLLGLQVVDEQGHSIGVLKEILETGANDVFVVQPPIGKEILLPVIESVFIGADLQTREIQVHLPPGAVETE